LIEQPSPFRIDFMSSRRHEIHSKRRCGPRLLDTGGSVDHAVVDHRELLTAPDALDEPVLPQRTIAVERLRNDPRNEARLTSSMSMPPDSVRRGPCRLRVLRCDGAR